MWASPPGIASTATALSATATEPPWGTRCWRTTTVPEGPVYENEYTIDYEAISIDDGLPVNDVLANGQRLERDDTVIPDVGMPVCRTGFTTGDACGSVTRIGNGWFRFNGPVIAKGDSGAGLHPRGRPHRARRHHSRFHDKPVR